MYIDLGFKNKQQYEKYKKKFQELPYLTMTTLRDGSREHLEAIKGIVVSGVRKNNLGYSRLSPMTMNIRKALNENSKPISPFVGDKKMLDSLEIVPDGKAFMLRPNSRYAVSKSKFGKISRISWKRVWRIQEWGAVIPVTEKMRNYFSSIGIFLKSTTLQLVIPARRPFQRAYNRYIRSQIRQEINKAMINRLKQLMRPTK